MDQELEVEILGGPLVWRSAMSLGAIQDNLAKTSLVQQTQTRVDDVQRGQEIAQTHTQREDGRQADQVVIHLQKKEEHGIRADEEKEKEGGKKKRGGEGEDKGENRDSSGGNPETGPEAREGEPGPRAVMRKINIVI